MKKSKNIITRFFQEFSKKFLTNDIYSIILLLRFRNKFKRSINRAKSSEIYSNNLDKINRINF